MKRRVYNPSYRAAAATIRAQKLEQRTSRLEPHVKFSSYYIREYSYQIPIIWHLKRRFEQDERKLQVAAFAIGNKKYGSIL